MKRKSQILKFRSRMLVGRAIHTPENNFQPVSCFEKNPSPFEYHSIDRIL